MGRDSHGGGLGMEAYRGSIRKCASVSSLFLSPRVSTERSAYEQIRFSGRGGTPSTSDCMHSIAVRHSTVRFEHRAWHAARMGITCDVDSQGRIVALHTLRATEKLSRVAL